MANYVVAPRQSTLGAAGGTAGNPQNRPDWGSQNQPYLSPAPGPQVIVPPTAQAAAPGATDPDQAKPGPAWMNRFTLGIEHTKQSVLYDYQLTFASSYSNPSGDIAFNALTTGYQSLVSYDPRYAKVSPPWANQFLRNQLTKQAVLYDYQLTFSGSSSAALVFGATSLGQQAIYAEPDIAKPGPAWSNQFLIKQLTKQSVLFDFQVSFTGTSTAALTLSTITAGYQSFVTYDPDAAHPGPAWSNQFLTRQLTKQNVLYDYQLTFSGSSSASLTFAAVTLGYQSLISYDPASALPGPAWSTRFRHLTKQVVLFNYTSSNTVTGITATVTVSGQDGTISGSANVNGVTATITVNGQTGVPSGSSNVTGVTATITVNGIPGTPQGGVAAVPQDRQVAMPGPAWEMQFGQDRSRRPSVLYDYQVTFSGNSAASLAFAALTLGYQSLISYDPAAANPGPAWVNQFFRQQLNKQSVLYDYQATFSGSSAATLAFAAITLGYQSFISYDPESAKPGPAWSNQFLTRQLTRQSVLFDYQVTFSGSSSASLAFNATSVAYQSFISYDPDAAHPGPAWSNQFLKNQLTKQSVLFDYQLAISASYSNPAGDIVFGATSVAYQSFISYDPQAAKPGQAWANQFLLNQLTKQAVLYDYQLTFTGSSTAVLVLGATSIAFVQSPALDPDISKPGPAWFNQFGHLSKQSVLFDFQVSFTGTSTASLAFSAITAGYQSFIPYDPASALFAPAWANRFALYRLSKQSVLSDYQLSLSGSSTAPLTFSAVTTGYQSLIFYDPQIALPGPAWRNRFGHLTRQRALYDFAVFVAGNANVNGVTATVSVNGIAGAISGSAHVSGVTSTVTVNSPPGTVSGSANVSGVTATVTVNGIAGTPKNSSNISGTTAIVIINAPPGTPAGTGSNANVNGTTATVLVHANTGLLLSSANVHGMTALISVIGQPGIPGQTFLGPYVDLTVEQQAMVRAAAAATAAERATWIARNQNESVATQQQNVDPVAHGNENVTTAKLGKYGLDSGPYPTPDSDDDADEFYPGPS